MNKITKPNIILIVVDDLGYSDLGPFGGEIRTPNIQKLSDNGINFRRFHVSSLCAPTRSMILSGVDNHLNGLGVMPPFHVKNQYKQKGYEGYLNHDVMTIAEVLREDGYRTFMSGKWHLGFHEGARPSERGFERSFSFLGGGASHFSDQRALSASEEPHTRYSSDGNTVMDLPDDFYSSDFYTDKMMNYIHETGPEEPFFGYLAYTAPHDPLQVPDAWLDRCKGMYDGGYKAIKEGRLKRLKEMGLVDKSATLESGVNLYLDWDKLSPEEKKEQSRKMELYSAMVENVDWNLGRLFEFLRKENKFDNTVFIFMSDNGANPKEPHFYPPNTEELIEKNYDNSIENMGKMGSFVSIGEAWAEICNTPLSYYKTSAYSGGTQTPLIISGKSVVARGFNKHDLVHGTDLFPTILDLTATKRPHSFKGRKLVPLYGKSLVNILRSESASPHRSEDESICFEMIGCRSIIKGKWKALLENPPYGNGLNWRLYNIEQDIAELHDLSEENPAKLSSLRQEWEEYAEAVGFIEPDGEMVLKDMGAEEFYRSIQI